MNANVLEDMRRYLRLALYKIQKQKAEYERNHAYDAQARRLRIMAELIKEQIPNEDPSHSTRPAR